MKAISLFACAGVGEMRLKDIGVDVVAANELLKNRANAYSHFYPESRMVVGDIRDVEVKKTLKEEIDKHSPDLLMATPPCQGLSSLGKNKVQSHYELDQRNYLIFDIFELIDYGDLPYILIENVPIFLKMYFPYKDELRDLEYILKDKYSKKYNIEISVLNAEDYGVPQSRPRAIIRMFKKDKTWELPKKEAKITLKDAIGHLPSLEPGEKSKIDLHYAKKINNRYELALKHTATGESAISNSKFYPKKENGERIKGFHNTFKRMQWDSTCPARTTYCANVNSHNNVHPGRKKPDGTYSDARALTLLETYIVSSIPLKTRFPVDVSDNFIYTMIGEGIPPLFLKKIISGIK